MKKSTKHSKAGLEIIEALTEIRDALRDGVPLRERFTVRTVYVPEPGQYDAKAIKLLRKRLGVSQPVFADIVGVSTVLAQKWEQGTRKPDGAARRLLDEIKARPEHFMKLIVHNQVSKAA